MTPWRSGRTAEIVAGVRPIIRSASAPTACTCPSSVSIATTEGSATTMPWPPTYTSVFAVPRSIAMSLTPRVGPNRRRDVAPRTRSLPKRTPTAWQTPGPATATLPLRASGEHGHRRVVAGDAADAAAARARAADEDRRVVGLDAPAAGVLVVVGKRPRELTVEDVAARHAQLALEVGGAEHVDARLSGGRSHDAAGDRLGEHAVQRPQRRLEGGAAGGGRVAVEEPRRHVQSEDRHRVRAGGDERGAEDARVAQRVAVRLA